MTKPFLILILAFCVYPNALEAQNLSGKELKWLNKKAIPLETNYKAGDKHWQKLDKYFKNKDVVMLGEFTHGSQEIFEVHNDLIRYLHEKHEFNVVLFESGIGEMETVDFEKSRLTAKEMTYGLIGPWRKQAFVELMAYVKEKGMAVAGFDVQRSGRIFHRLLTEICQQHELDTLLYHDLESRFGKTQRALRNRKTVYDSISVNTLSLISDYKKLSGLLSGQESDPSSEKELLIIRTLENRIGFLDYFLTFVKNKDWEARWTARDSIMADNVMWLRKHIFPGEKVIILAHNFHIALHNEKAEVMGEFLLRSIRTNEMYSIGFFAGNGSYANNSGKEAPMDAPDPDRLDIRHVIGELPDQINFLTIPEKENSCSQFLFKPIVINNSFIDLFGSDQLTPARQFDALILLKQSSPPE